MPTLGFSFTLRSASSKINKANSIPPALQSTASESRGDCLSSASRCALASDFRAHIIPWPDRSAMTDACGTKRTIEAVTSEEEEMSYLKATVSQQRLRLVYTEGDRPSAANFSQKIGPPRDVRGHRSPDLKPAAARIETDHQRPDRLFLASRETAPRIRLLPWTSTRMIQA